MILIVMGVCGCGKSTVGEMLAERLGCAFSDADSYHPPANVDKMRAGIPLTDDDRGPWLSAIRTAADGWQQRGESHIVACSALKQAYRDILSPQGDIIFVYLKGSKDVIRPRLEARKGHYMNPTLLDSQFAILEEPLDALTVDIQGDQQQIVTDVLRLLPDFVSPPERPFAEKVRAEASVGPIAAI